MVLFKNFAPNRRVRCSHLPIFQRNPISNRIGAYIDRWCWCTHEHRKIHWNAELPREQSLDVWRATNRHCNAPSEYSRSLSMDASWAPLADNRIWNDGNDWWSPWQWAWDRANRATRVDISNASRATNTSLDSDRIVSHPMRRKRIQSIDCLCCATPYTIPDWLWQMDRPDDRPESIANSPGIIRCNRNRRDTFYDKLRTLLLRPNANTDEWRRRWWSENLVICKWINHCPNRLESSAVDRPLNHHEIPMALDHPMWMSRAILCWTLQRIHRNH